MYIRKEKDYNIELSGYETYRLDEKQYVDCPCCKNNILVKIIDEKVCHPGAMSGPPSWWNET